MQGLGSSWRKLGPETRLVASSLPSPPLLHRPPLRTCSATLWYTYMALTNMQMEVQALETLATASGVNSSIWMYGSTCKSVNGKSRTRVGAEAIVEQRYTTIEYRAEDLDVGPRTFLMTDSGMLSLS